MRFPSLIKRFRCKPHLLLIRVLGTLVPRRLRRDWRHEWESELCHRETMLGRWDRLDGRHKLDLLRRSTSAFWDVLWLQPKRLEDEMFQDLRYGIRMLLKQPVFTLIAAMSLALGIGANTAIFSLLDVLLLKSLPVSEPERLVLFGNGEMIGATDDFPNRSWDLFAYPFYQEVRRRNEVFTEVAALLSMQLGVHGTVDRNGTGGEAEKIEVQLVSGTYFSVLGVNASLGRALTEADDQTPGGHPVAVVSHAWWEHRLGGLPTAIGQTVTIDRTAYTIIGVAPPEFFGTMVGQAPDIWIPLAMEARIPPFYWTGRSEKSFQSLYLIARLKPGVGAERAGAAVNLLFKQSVQERAGAQPAPEISREIQQARIELTPAGKGLSRLRRQFSLSLRVLMAVVGVVLLIACANVANLLLARAAARQREFAVRLAVGAGRIRLIRQLLTESMLLAGLGGIAGMVLAWWGGRLLVSMASAGSQPLPLDVAPNPRVLGFTLFASLLSAVIFGTAPALSAARIELNSALKGGKGVARATSQNPLGKALVVMQVALSLLLLVGAGLFVRTLINLQNAPTGIDQQNVLLFKTDTAATGYKDAQFPPLLREVEEKVKTLPGVQGASFASFIINQCCWTGTVYTHDPTPPEGEARVVRHNVVGSDYFTTMGIPLILGRSFGPQDTSQSRKVAVISETMARRFFPNDSPLGKLFGIDGPQSSVQAEIIGVVKDARYRDLTEELQPMDYYPHAQRPQPLGNLVVRFSGAPESIVPQVRQAIRQINRDLPIDEVVSISEHIGRSIIPQKLVARVASFFGLLALLLAGIGLYGVLSYAVVRRTNEIGIRMALGARRGDVLWLIIREALGLILIGVVIGLLATLAATQVASTLLFGLTPNDPLTIVAATSLLVAIAILAGYLPARRAAGVDPMAALQNE
ncbi:MAG TPA: ABC transporter permease [Blastocatellia bacterium]|nr:ABC transporter permease [Blastocatellia bacterium]